MQAKPDGRYFQKCAHEHHPESHLGSGGVVVRNAGDVSASALTATYLERVSRPLPTCLEAYDIIASWDTEWTTRTPAPIDGVSEPYNEVVSYQFAVLSGTEGEVSYAEHIYYPERGSRLRLADALGIVLRAAGLGRRRAERANVLLLAHYTAAEVSALDYRDRAMLKDALQTVQRTPVTMKSLKVSVDFGGHHRTKVAVTLRDTMLIAPADASRSLDAISRTTSLRKVDLPDSCRSHMDLVADSDPALFETYAMNDVRVCLEYYLNFMHDFEAMFPGVEHAPMTIGGAAVSAYKHWLKGRPELNLNKVRGKVEVLRRNRRKWLVSKAVPVRSREYTEEFARDAFMGGLNIAYETGRVLAGPNEVILDLDFSGAYAAAMANLPVID
jgi:hypothetical protein